MSTRGRDQAFVLFTDLPKAGPYLDALNRRGLEVLIITGPPHWPMEKVAISFVHTPGHLFTTVEEFAFIPAEDLPAIYAQLAAWQDRYDIVGVFASSEVFVEPAGQVAHLLGVPGVGLLASRVCRNKLLQRLYLRQWGPPAVLAKAGSHETVMRALEGRFPYVTKPLDMFCSIGVRVLADEAALADHLAGLEPSSSVLVEEYVAGREYSVESIVVAGHPVFSGVTQKLTSEETGDFFVEMAHTVPALNLTAAEEASLKATQAAVLERLGFGTGMTHGEYRLLPDGRVALMEIAARPPGDGILQLYHLATGASMELAAIDAALGREVDHPEPARFARQVYFEHQPGTLRDVTSDLPDSPAPTWLIDHGLWPSLDPAPRDAPAGLRQLLVLKNRGDELGPVVDSFGRAVTAMIDSPTADGLDTFEAELREAVRISCG
ncbi:MAG: ATP-grasp domain-containing protein [Beggiatoa sp.]|nr:ATP-grasp domain-containing protein [Beggiatoa sp.]